MIKVSILLLQDAQNAASSSTLKKNNKKKSKNDDKIDTDDKDNSVAKVFVTLQVKLSLNGYNLGCLQSLG